MDWQSFPDLLLPLVAVEGAFIIHRSDEALAALHQAQLEVLHIGSHVLLAFRPRGKLTDGTSKNIVPSLKGQVISILASHSLCLESPYPYSLNSSVRYADYLE